MTYSNYIFWFLFFLLVGYFLKKIARKKALIIGLGITAFCFFALLILFSLSHFDQPPNTPFTREEWMDITKATVIVFVSLNAGEILASFLTKYSGRKR